MVQYPMINFLNTNRLFIFFILICTIFVFSVSGKPVTERVAKIYHKGIPTELDGKEIEVIGESVALSEKINMKKGTKQIHTPSIFFVIDNSWSMWADDNKCRRDSMGNRFTVPARIIKHMADNPDDYEGVEVGVSIFGTGLFYEGDDDPKVLQTLPDSLNPTKGKSGAYVPLLKLHEDYDTKNGTKKGSDILQHYLGTKIIGSSGRYRYRFPTAPEDDANDGNTNIDLGFRAAVNAMKSSKSAKEDHYIIFLSDGAANQGKLDEYVEGYVVDTDSTSPDTNLIPTTFTIFFQDEHGGHPFTLDMMDLNIRNNGYSTSNEHHTQLWDFNNSTEEELFNFIRDNIIAVIMKKKVWKELQASGASGPGNWNEKDEAFILPSLIPLTGFKTPIQYNISFDFDTLNNRYTRFTRSSSVQTIDVNFDVIIDHDLPKLDDEFQAFHWERTIGFYDKNGNGVDVIEDEVIEFEVKFSNDPKDAKYEYTNVKIEIRCERSGDIELFTLKKEEYQKYGLKIIPKLTGDDAKKNNGTLECRLYDKLTATFRNSESTVLPLDTIQTSLIIKADFVQIHKAIYFDNNANGRIDSIFVKLLGECNFTDDDLSLIKGKIKLPEHRKFTIKKINLHENGVSFNVSQSSSIDINTAVTDKDRVVLNEEIRLEDEGKIFKGETAIIDSVAPVIMRAQLVDYIQPDGEDRLTITFSEKIDSISNEKPFLFYSLKKDKEYQAKLRLLSQGDDTAVFTIVSFDDYDRKRISPGDSINIFKDGEVSDLVSNPQENPGNIRREVEIEWIPTTFEVKVVSTLKTVEDQHMYIQVEPVDLEFSTDLDSMAAEFDIYDAVGNIVRKGLKMKYYYSDDKMYLRYKWNCRNHIGREVGRGTYLGVFHIRAYFLEEDGDILTKTEYDPKTRYLAVKD